MLTVQVHTFVGTLSIVLKIHNISWNSASVKNWPISARVGITDPNVWAVWLVWPLGRGDMRSSTFWKGNNSWSRETENKGKALNLWECDPFCQQGWLVGQVLCLLCSVSSEKHTTVPYTSTEFREIQLWSWKGDRCSVSEVMVCSHHALDMRPCCQEFPSHPPGSLNIIHLTVFKMGGGTEAGGLPVWGQPGLWNETPFYPFFPPKPFMICCWAQTERDRKRITDWTHDITSTLPPSLQSVWITMCLTREKRLFFFLN